MTVARGLARHMAGVDPAAEVPPVGLLPCGNGRTSRCSIHICATRTVNARMSGQPVTLIVKKPSG